MNSRRNKNVRRSSERDGVNFVALPWVVLDSPAYTRLSHTAKNLLIELARQYNSHNNGRLLASLAYLRTRGWNSADVIDRAKRQLLKEGFIHQTVMGHLPNKASWYALTWLNLDKLDGYDFGTAESFVRSAYQADVPLNPKPTRPELFEKWKDAGKTAPVPVRLTERRQSH